MPTDDDEDDKVPLAELARINAVPESHFESGIESQTDSEDVPLIAFSNQHQNNAASQSALDSQESQSSSENVPLASLALKEQIAKLEAAINRHLADSKIRQVRTIKDLSKKEIQSKTINGMGTLVDNDTWNVADLKSLLGIGWDSSFNDTVWWVSDALLDVFSTLALIYCHKDDQKICIIRGQFRKAIISMSLILYQ